MQNRGKLSFLWQFTLFVVSSRIAVGIRSSLALENRKTLTITQKGFLHDIPIGEYLEVFADVRILSEWEIKSVLPDGIYAFSLIVAGRNNLTIYVHLGLKPDFRLVYLTK